MGARRRRRYALYVSGTQPQADKHVQNIGRLLESNAFADMYPGMGSRGVNKYGTAKGWRRNQLQTGSGFVVDAIGRLPGGGAFASDGTGVASSITGSSVTYAIGGAAESGSPSTTQNTGSGGGAGPNGVKGSDGANGVIIIRYRTS